MLARGVLCRLAADLPNTSTHDLPRISQLLRSTLAAHNRASRPTVGTVARAFHAAILHGRRGYATKTATKPAARATKAVKKAPAKKTAKKPAAKKPKKAGRPAAKKKAVPKKAVRKPKKEVTPEQKEAAAIKELKKKALVDTPARSVSSAWSAFVAEHNKGASSVAEASQSMKGASEKFKNLTPAEREHYNHLANQKKEAAAAEYDAWIRKHTPEEIRVANNARAQLRRKLKLVGTQNKKYIRLIDPRATRTTARTNPYIIFVQERLKTGDFKGIASKEIISLIGGEWRALSPGEKKKYEDEAKAAKAAA